MEGWFPMEPCKPWEKVQEQRETLYEPSWSEEDVKAGLDNGTLVKGVTPRLLQIILPSCVAEFLHKSHLCRTHMSFGSFRSLQTAPSDPESVVHWLAMQHGMRF